MGTQETKSRPPRELLTAWLLLILSSQGTDHGYSLRAKLEHYGLDVEPTVLYRTLRSLDESGHVSSEWGTTVSGPKRRLYSITQDGRELLGALVGPIEATRDAHNAFLKANEEKTTSIK